MDRHHRAADIPFPTTRGLHPDCRGPFRQVPGHPTHRPRVTSYPNLPPETAVSPPVPCPPNGRRRTRECPVPSLRRIARLPQTHGLLPCTCLFLNTKFLRSRVLCDTVDRLRIFA